MNKLNNMNVIITAGLTVSPATAPHSTLGGGSVDNIGLVQSIPAFVLAVVLDSVSVGEEGNWVDGSVAVGC